MPHLMFETFMSQWIWLAIFIFTLYFKLVTDLIPSVSNAFKARRTLESGDVVLSTSSHQDSISLDIKKPSILSSNSSYSKVLADSRTKWSSP
jgi:hypothetical protein